MDLDGKKNLVSKNAKISIKRQCDLLDLNRTSVYVKPTNNATSDEDERILVLIDKIHTELPSWGQRRIQAYLRNKHDIIIGRTKLRTLMNLACIEAIYPKPNLSKSNATHKKYPYLLKNLKINRPNQVWAIDITYLPMKQGHMYLVAIIDWYSKYIVGYQLSDSLDVQAVLECVSVAITIHGKPEIINSDQGSQFTSDAYVKLLKDNNITISMDGKGRWADNICIERFFRTLKYDDIYIYHYQTPRDLRKGIDRFMNIYNNIHPHQANNYLPPVEIFTQNLVA